MISGAIIQTDLVRMLTRLPWSTLFSDETRDAIRFDVLQAHAPKGAPIKVDHTDAYIAKLRALYDEFDIDRSGFIDRSEVHPMLQLCRCG